VHFAAVTIEPPQPLDIFAHSRGVLLRNAVIEAVERYDAAAREAANRLAGDFADARCG
jgi:hypothetical protein